MDDRRGPHIGTRENEQAPNPAAVCPETGADRETIQSCDSLGKIGCSGNVQQKRIIFIYKLKKRNPSCNSFPLEWFHIL